jgi:ATP-dependent protease ClpP protease subunit
MDAHMLVLHIIEVGVGCALAVAIFMAGTDGHR